MKRLLIAVFAIASSYGAPALAADMAIKAPPIVAPPAFSWTGLYLGIDGGGGWGRETYIDNAPLLGTPQSHRPDGGIFGGVLGYRYQIGQIVLGVEGTGAWADIKDTIPAGLFTETFKARSLYTATGQIGWAFNHALLYVKGGWAGASVDNFLNSAFGSASNTQTNRGWTVGAGLDYTVWQNVVLGAEYDRIGLDYSEFTAPFSGGGTPWIVTNTGRFTIDQVIGRLTYKFNMP